MSTFLFRSVMLFRKRMDFNSFPLFIQKFYDNITHNIIVYPDIQEVLVGIGVHP